MSDRSRKCFQMILNVDAQARKMRAPSRIKRPRLHLNINLEVRPQDDIYDPEFMLSDPDGGDLVSIKPHGRDQEIDLKKLPIKPVVFFHVHLTKSKGLRFLVDPEQVIGINKADVGSLDTGCPKKAGIATDPFEIMEVSSKGKHMTLRDKNNDGGTYRFALFVYRRNSLVAVCDPRIINK